MNATLFAAPTRLCLAKWLAIALQAAIWLTAHAAPILLPGTGAPMQQGESYPSPTYSWFAMPALGGRGFVLAHLPPRGADEHASRAAQDGVYRSAIRLDDQPEAMAAWGESVFVVFSPRPEAGPNAQLGSRSVFTLRAKRFSDSDLWVDEPSGRMQALPGLPGKATLLGFSAIDDGPCALYVDSDSGALRLAVLERDWRSIELPAELTGPRRKIQANLAGDASGIVLLHRTAAEWVVWRANPVIDRARAETLVKCQWSRSTLKPAGLAGINPNSEFEYVAGRWYAIDEPTPGTLRISEIAESGVRLVAEIKDNARFRAIAPMDGLARLIVLSTSEESETDPATGASSIASTRTKVTEISLLSGRVLYSGAARTINPLGSSQFRLIAVGLILAMAFILVLVIRSDEPTEPHLPEGYSLAEPMRRAIAGAIDFAIASLLIPRLTGNSVLELLGPSVWLDGEAYQTLAMVAGLGMLIGTAGEYFFGRSPGKLMTDCEVISIATQTPNPSGELPRPSLPSCLIRNAIKWFLAPVAILALMDATGRHRGDQIARAAVVIRFDPTEEESDPFGDD